MYISYTLRIDKFFAIFFKLPKWAHLSELLEVFSISPIVDLINTKFINIVQYCLSSRFKEIAHLTQCVLYGL